jgi:uncharacterized protein YndB with AHSA1/START domain
VEPAEHAPAHIVELSTGIRSSPAAVWEAMLDPERQPTWLGGFRFVGDWVIGGPVALVGTLNGREYREGGVLLAFEPQKRLAYSHWSAFWRVPDTPGNRAVLTIGLAPEGDGTRASVHHALPEVEAIAPHSRFFWRGALEQLRRLREG